MGNVVCIAEGLLKWRSQEVSGEGSSRVGSQGWEILRVCCSQEIYSVDVTVYGSLYHTVHRAQDDSGD